MPKDWSGVRSLLVTVFPMFIATLSLVTSIYNGYLNSRFVDIIQNNVARVEHMRTCRDVIEAYFQVKIQVNALADLGERTRAQAASRGLASGSEKAQAETALGRFAALGTYLANLQDESARYRYTQLSLQLGDIVGKASQVPADQLKVLLEAADTQFGAMNADCVRVARRGQP
ncbi:MAG: hypothetical protein ACKVP7_11015 [Hyphomicrobiaceae bacterium]